MLWLATTMALTTNVTYVPKFRRQFTPPFHSEFNGRKDLQTQFEGVHKPQEETVLTNLIILISHKLASGTMQTHAPLGEVAS